jgi:hypothetical protein
MAVQTQATASNVPAPPILEAVIDPWDQQLDENELWYCRFLRYVALGPGRSVSLVATGRRNAYPVPAHWPIQAKQRNWRARANAFDHAVLRALKSRDTIEDEVELISEFNFRLQALHVKPPKGEGPWLTGAIEAGGYQLPPSIDDDELPVSNGLDEDDE